MRRQLEYASVKVVPSGSEFKAWGKKKGWRIIGSFAFRILFYGRLDSHPNIAGKLER